MLRCDFSMSSGERDSLNLGFPYLICFAGQNLIKISEVKSPVDSEYDARKDV